MSKSAHTSSRKSPTLDKLVDLVSEGGKLRAIAKTGTMMHRLVDFYESPIGYIGRLKTIRSVSDLAIQDARFTDICRPLAAWRPYIDAVLADPDKIADGLFPKSPQRSWFLAATGPDPLRGRALKRHGLEGFLWPPSNLTEEQHQQRYLTLQGQMLIAQVSILTVEFAVARTMSTEIPDESVYKYCYGPCHFARRFSQGDWQDALNGLPHVVDPENYREGLEELLAECKKTKEAMFYGVEKQSFQETLGSISAFIRRGIAGRKFHKRKRDGSGSVNRRPITVTSRTVGADGDSSTASPVAEIVTRTRGSAQEREELDRAGECPEDHLTRREFILTAGGPRMAEHVRAAQDRANQLLPNRYEESHPREFERLILAIYNAPRFLRSGQDRLELMAWIWTIFWLSCSPKQATGLMVGSPDTPLPSDFDFFLRLEINEDLETTFVPRICVRVIEPPYRTEYVPIKGERSRESYFELADICDLAWPIGKLLEQLRAKGERPDLLAFGEQAIRIFPETEETYLKRLSEFVASARLNFTVDASELGKVLFQRAKEVGDIVSADLITCKNHHLAEVRRWYFTPSVEHLRSVHERAVSTIMADLKMTDWEEKLETRRLPESESYVGSRRCAEWEFLKQSVKVLRDIIGEVVAVRSDKDRRQLFVEKHAALTVLAIWAIDICIGMRGTSHLYLHPSEYDRETGFGSITEKGKARAFQLCQSARDIAAKYDQYLDRLASHGLPRSTRKMPCFFLEEIDGMLQPVPASPSSMKKSLGSLFSFDPNWARRAVKTKALEQWQPAIYSDQYCNHAFRGEERHHPFGSFDPSPYFQAMMKFTEDILKEITLTPDLFNPDVVEPWL
jgi:hypothetical protein